MTRTRISKAKIGDRVKWQSLDGTVAPAFGKIIALSPSGTRAEIEWDDGDTYFHDLAPWHPESCTRLVHSQPDAQKQKLMLSSAYGKFKVRS